MEVARPRPAVEPMSRPDYGPTAVAYGGPLSTYMDGSSAAHRRLELADRGPLLNRWADLTTGRPRLSTAGRCQLTWTVRQRPIVGWWQLADRGPLLNRWADLTTGRRRLPTAGRCQLTWTVRQRPIVGWSWPTAARCWTDEQTWLRADRGCLRRAAVNLHGQFVSGPSSADGSWPTAARCWTDEQTWLRADGGCLRRAAVNLYGRFVSGPSSADSSWPTAARCWTDDQTWLWADGGCLWRAAVHLHGRFVSGPSSADSSWPTAARCRTDEQAWLRADGGCHQWAAAEGYNGPLMGRCCCAIWDTTDCYIERCTYP